MNFAQIPGQKEIISRLIRSVREERVSHAQIFAGPEGCGSFALAFAYAKYISCENRNDSDSCGSCKSCVKYEKLIHPDLHFVFPVIKGKKPNEPVSDNYIDEWREMVRKSPFITLNGWLESLETGNLQGMIYTAEAAEIIKKLSLKTFESDFKIMIIWLPEKMNQTASNKLLKLIEEPPDKTIFLLVSEEPDKLLPTILSRCQLLKIPVFSQVEISNYLEGKGIRAEKAADIARISMGNISRATQLSEQEESSHANLERFKLLMRFAYKRDVLSLMNWSEEISAADRESQKNFIVFSLRMLRENLMLTLGQDKNRIVFLSGEESDFSGKFHPFINYENIDSLASEFNLAHAHMEANGNAKIIFLDLGLKVAKVIR
jgi:DNA polymerase III subunit delta'